VVLSLMDVFGKGAKDEDWIPKVGELDAVVITQDFNITRKQAQNELYRLNKVGSFIINPPKGKGYSYWQLVTILIVEWEKIKNETKNNPKPFAFIHNHVLDFQN
jgi:hypothetical protein